jgi:hypothetical protein
MSAFARHNIKHLSPSSLNCWRETPGLWCLRYLAGAKDEGSPAMNRGTAVERGLELILRGSKLDDATKFAKGEFAKLNLGVVSDDYEAEAELIPGMVASAFKGATTELGNLELAATQLRVETWLEGVSVPVIGFVDFCMMDGPDVDLKTTKRCPSTPTPAHLRQVALYHRARQRPAALLYVTDKRHAYFAPSEEDLEAAVSELASAARSLERFLSLVPDAETALRCMPHPVDHYSYGDAAKSKLMELNEAF